MTRKIISEFNKFPSTPAAKLQDPKSIGNYAIEIDINLNLLASTYLIEEFDHRNPLATSIEYPALRFLKATSDLFIFNEGQPGIAKDSRKEQSRVLGQT